MNEAILKFKYVNNINAIRIANFATKIIFNVNYI
jgi:hypothetical protein